MIFGVSLELTALLTSPPMNLLDLSDKDFSNSGDGNFEESSSEDFASVSSLDNDSSSMNSSKFSRVSDLASLIADDLSVLFGVDDEIDDLFSEDDDDDDGENVSMEENVIVTEPFGVDDEIDDLFSEDDDDDDGENLILAAIEVLDSKNGATKSRISKQIEASYGSVPAAHKTLLSHHLNKMRASGELALIKNNYLKVDRNTPPPRGRPSKPKEPVPEGTVISPPRLRGRPRKSLDPSNPIPAPSVSGRKRGRPRKTVVPSTGEEKGRSPPLTEGDSTLPPSAGEKRGRGRPRKVKTYAGGSGGERRGRGRPRKVEAAAPERV
ncbi:hypothetical protein L1987_69143 [Smallanthus sonchifolius]|uniref:Uncharacterized protein n=1 Tax=Smallanthus sonchifolius TaxID=185202 RepID=A0ACB9B5Z2_9ASTR|nr:hypothetical protein L1987_69143 [Smallanthus sonchifolius]